jgi:polyisoprenoid-binding protein YceI
MNSSDGFRWGRGVWRVDPTHSTVSFVVRRVVGPAVRGWFGTFAGTIVTAEDLASSFAAGHVDASSIDTGRSERDERIRSSVLLDVHRHPTIAFRLAGLVVDAHPMLMLGDVTIRGDVHRLRFQITELEVRTDPWGGTRLCAAVTGVASRSALGFRGVLPGVLDRLALRDEVLIRASIEAVLEPS